MGTPRYGTEYSKQRRELQNTISDAFTVATKANSRPYVPPVISDVSSSRWSPSPLKKNTDLQCASHINSHPTFYITVKVAAPTAGSYVRIIDSNSSTVLYESPLLASGANTVTFTISLAGVVGYYGEFAVKLQAKSVTSGQTTSAVFYKFYGGD